MWVRDTTRALGALLCALAGLGLGGCNEAGEPSGDGIGGAANGHGRGEVTVVTPRPTGLERVSSWPNFGYECPDSKVVSGDEYFFGDTYHVAPTGSDDGGDGSKEAPWKTLAHAVSRVPAREGHRILLAAGEYQIDEPIKLPRGINLEGAGRENTILRYGGEFAEYTRLLVLNSDNLSQDRIDEMREPGNEGWLNGFLAMEGIDDDDLQVGPFAGRQWVRSLAIDGSDKQLYGGIFVHGRSDVLIEDVAVDGTRHQAISVVGLHGHEDTSDLRERWATGIEISGVTLTRCSSDHDHKGYHQGISSGCIEYGRTVGMRIHNSSVSNLTDDINENAGHGYGMLGSGPVSGIMIYNNTVLSPGVDVAWETDQTIEIKRGQDDCLVCNNTLNQYVSFTDGSAGTGRHSVVFFQNRLVMNPAQVARKMGVEIALDDATFFSNYIENVRRTAFVVLGYVPANNTSIHHNIVRFTAETLSSEDHKGGVSLGNRGDGVKYIDVRIDNNTFVGLRRGIQLDTSSSPGGSFADVWIRNNLFVDTETGVRVTGDGRLMNSVTVSRNFSSGVETPFEEDLEAGSFSGMPEDALTGTPELENEGDMPFPALVPTPTSPLVDAGQDVGLPFFGSAPDIGAFEAPEG